MENQHRAIKGYRELTESKVSAMKDIEAQVERLGALVAMLWQIPELDQRWLSIGVTDLQNGLMALMRAVAKPTPFDFQEK